ncbi:UNVERIFIED_CONTAM: hypothetical protein FKN15_022088 [Acipenser sinensis]
MGAPKWHIQRRHFTGSAEAPYSLEISSSNPGYAIVDRGRESRGGGVQLAERRPGWEGLGRQGNPCLIMHQRPLWQRVAAGTAFPPATPVAASSCWNCISSSDPCGSE